MQDARGRMGIVVMLVYAALAGGCYHAIVETGRSPGAAVLDTEADSFSYGLASPDAVRTAEDCAGGIARVETHHSFMNTLVGVLTVGLYNPMEILVSCAATGESVGANGLRVEATTGADGIASAIEQAARASLEANAPAFVILPE